MPRSSGLLNGSGFQRYRCRKSVIRGWGKNFPDRAFSDLRIIREEVPDFDPALEFDYTRRELALMAEKILVVDGRSPTEKPMILNAGMYRERLRHEIYTAVGTPDPEINEGMYWRSHPNGRPFSTEEVRRATGCGFYGVIETEREIPPPPAPKVFREEIMCIGPECDRRAVSPKRRLCPGHATQFYTGKDLTPIRMQLSDEKIKALKASWDTGESHAAVARRLGVSTRSAAKYRQDGQIEALRKISEGQV